MATMRSAACRRRSRAAYKAAVRHMASTAITPPPSDTSITATSATSIGHFGPPSSACHVAPNNAKQQNRAMKDSVSKGHSNTWLTFHDR